MLVRQVVVRRPRAVRLYASVTGKTSSIRDAKQRLVQDFNARPVEPLSAMAERYPDHQETVKEHFLFESMKNRVLWDMMFDQESLTLWSFVDFRADGMLGNTQGFVHGGLTAAVFDGALGTLFTLSGTPGFTANLQVDYRKPVPIPSRLLLRCSIDNVDGRKMFISGKLTEAEIGSNGEGSGALFAEATSLFLAWNEAS